MKQLNKQERHEVYKQALLRLRDYIYICPTIGMAIQDLHGDQPELKDDLSTLTTEENFPEFFSLNPNPGYVWFTGSQPRIDCLNKCIEMTRP